MITSFNYFLHTSAFSQLQRSFVIQEMNKGFIERIKQAVIDVFVGIVSFFKSFGSQTNEINLKPLAMIGCLLLIGIIAISILRRRDRHNISSTPFRRSLQLPQN